MTRRITVFVVALICLALLPLGAMAETTPEVEAMLPAMDSLLIAMGHGERAYAPRDPDFFWSGLYLMAVNWSEQVPAAQHDEAMSELILPRQYVQELATALFADYDDLLEIPESMSAAVKFDEATDGYRFALSDRGDAFTQIESVEMGADGGATVNLVFKGYEDEDTVLDRVRFELVPNAYVDGIAKPTYVYSVVAAEPAL